MCCSVKIYNLNLILFFVDFAMENTVFTQLAHNNIYVFLFTEDSLQLKSSLLK